MNATCIASVPYGLSLLKLAGFPIALSNNWDRGYIKVPPKINAQIAKPIDIHEPNAADNNQITPVTIRPENEPTYTVRTSC